MKIPNPTKNRRKDFAWKPLCPNCGKPGNHCIPISLKDILDGKRPLFTCEPCLLTQIIKDEKAMLNDTPRPSDNKILK